MKDKSHFSAFPGKPENWSTTGFSLIEINHHRPPFSQKRDTQQEIPDGKGKFATIHINELSIQEKEKKNKKKLQNQTHKRIYNQNHIHNRNKNL